MLSLKASETNRELYTARQLIRGLEREDWSPELELEFSFFIAERAGFADIVTDGQFMAAYTRDFVKWR